ncbi:hypothetical protein B0H17DRAFT_1094926, partial [Mycena rosella]
MTGCSGRYGSHAQASGRPRRMGRAMLCAARKESSAEAAPGASLTCSKAPVCMRVSSSTTCASGGRFMTAMARRVSGGTSNVGETESSRASISVDSAGLRKIARPPACEERGDSAAGRRLEPSGHSDPPALAQTRLDQHK